jgi:hypothetical protein
VRSILKHALDDIYLNCCNVKEKIEGRGSGMTIGSKNNCDWEGMREMEGNEKDIEVYITNDYFHSNFSRNYTNIIYLVNNGMCYSVQCCISTVY